MNEAPEQLARRSMDIELNISEWRVKNSSGLSLAVRGLSANLGEVPADTFFKDQHSDLKTDYIMATIPPSI